MFLKGERFGCKKSPSGVIPRAFLVCSFFVVQIITSLLHFCKTTHQDSLFFLPSKPYHRTFSVMELPFL